MPAEKRWLTRRRLYVLLFLILAISLTHRLRYGVDLAGFVLAGDVARDPFDLRLPAFEITGLEPESEAAGLRVGDLIVEVEGRPLDGAAVFYRTLRELGVGDRLTLTVQTETPRGPERNIASIDLQSLFGEQPSAALWANLLFISLVIPFSCMALGFWVAAVRIQDKLAWLLLLLMLSVAEFLGVDPRTLYGRTDIFQPIAAIYQPLLANLAPTAMMLFGIYFPDRLPFDRRFPWAKWLVMAPILFRVAGTSAITDALFSHHLAAAAAVARAFRPMAGYVAVLHLIAVLLFFGLLAYKSLTASDADARRRLLLLDAGTALAVFPLVIALVASAAIGGTVGGIPALVALSLLFLFPLTMAYVIVVHRAMDVRVVIRQGLQYLLARGGVRVVQLTVTVGIATTATLVAMDPGANLTGRIVLISAGIAAIVLIRRFAERMRRAVDRRFFREAYNAEEILGDLAGSVRAIVETGPLLETVVRRISESLHVPRVALLLGDGNAFRPAYALGYGAPPTAVLPHDGLTVERLRREAHAHVRFDAGDS
jgi:sigma-B regulation protein RsbU (phosphoserine phosphatase)